MSDDIVARVRVWSRWLGERVSDSAVGDDLREAADEIERLRAERDELQKWKDSHNTFWRDRAERRDAIRDEIERLRARVAELEATDER